MRRAVPILCLALGLSACAEPLEFADWTIPVPEGTRIIEYAGVPIEERTEKIELEEDLVLGADDTDPNQVFYRPTDVAIDRKGRIFVVDSGNHRIQTFNADGSFVATLGREGQGPGEFGRALSATVIGDRLLVSDRENVQLSIWSTDGTYLEDVEVDIRMRGLSFVAGVDDGYAVIRYSPPRIGQSFALGALGLDGKETIQYVELPVDRTPTLQRGRLRSFGYGNPRAYPSFASARDGNVYITPGGEYQVLALDPEGSPRWAMRIAWERPAMPQELRQTVLESVRRSFPDVTESEINYLDRLPSVSRLAVDGEGRLFVYLYVPPDPSAEGVFDVPVDVYSSDGEHLFSGMVPNRGWRRADGDFVYGTGRDRVSGEYRMFRWRLVGPFE